jgi:hypothetical protein
MSIKLRARMDLKKVNTKKRASALYIKTILIMFSRENSKLCFEMLEMNSASQNHLPARGWKTPPKSTFF